MVSLPKPVLDRIHRYAEEGRVPRTRYEHDYCLLLAEEKWQSPAVVLLRCTPARFAEMRTAALAEWTRTARRKRSAAAARRAA
jgi:hypothetical protein